MLKTETNKQKPSQLSPVGKQASSPCSQHLTPQPHPLVPMALLEPPLKVKVLVTQLRLTFATPWTIAHQTLLSRQEYWSGLPFPSAGDLPDSEIEI